MSKPLFEFGLVFNPEHRWSIMLHGPCYSLRVAGTFHTKREAKKAVVALAKEAKRMSYAQCSQLFSAIFQATGLAPVA